jgi:hypothetical protein
MSSDVATAVDLSVPNAAPSHREIFGARQFAIVIALVIFADWLFYDRSPGISIALFFAAIAVGFIVANPHQIQKRALWSAVVIFFLSVLPLVIELSFPAFLFGLFGAAYFVIAATRADVWWRVQANEIVTLLFQTAWRVVPDVFAFAKKWAAGERATSGFGALIVWLMPLALGAVFLTLFASANPLIEHLFVRIDMRALLAHISVSRLGFWLLAFAFVWPFIFFVRRSTLGKFVASQARAIISEAEPISLPDTLFGQAAILRSLVVFNILFAVQTGLDALYLWGGVALPNGMSYAAYAHRGAYPLIVTALLAAAFVIAAMRPGSATEKSPLIRTLVFIWTAQNVLLVGSALLRLDLYVNSYSLTYWRLAAAIWMLLVGTGLILIVVRIVLRRSNAWLVRMNFASLALTLYVCCFLNLPHIIATYNIAHSREVTGAGPSLDWCYLMGLGPQIIPAVDSYFRSHSGEAGAGAPRYVTTGWRQNAAQKHLSRMQDWRAWTYRDSRLATYLKSNPNGSVGQ